MRSHARIRKSLFEFLKDELDPELRARIDNHLRSCPECRAELKGMRRVTSLLTPSAATASDERSEEFWNTFSAQVEDRIDFAQGRPRAALQRLRESFHAVLSMRWRTAVAIGGAFALLTASFLLIYHRPDTAGDIEPVASVNTLRATDPVDKNVNGYFRKSQTVLIGVSNKKASDHDDIDAERTVSRELVSEARRLRHQRLDPQSARLVGDLERIFIKIANTDSRQPGRDMEMVRVGIRSENLLFKVRMAQARYEPESNQ